jgi:DNA repair exonuclease SbcCD nuclease subunit
MRKAVGVLISDVHFSLSTLQLAVQAFMRAIKTARELNVPLYVTGDLHDSKALIRGECANALLECMRQAKNWGVEVVILIGNHDMINEKGEAHSLNFLEGAGAVIFDRPNCVQLDKGLVAHLIPYQNDGEKFVELVHGLKKGSLILCHQGVRGAYMGEYVVDKTSVDPSLFKDYAIISGHYHRRQTIVTDGKKHDTYFGVGTWNYVGSPYSTTFAEAGDGDKGIQILFNDMSMQLVPTGLRKHVIIEVDLEGLDILLHTASHPNPDDAVWLKVTGPALMLDKLSKKEIGMKLLGHANYRLDKIPNDEEVQLQKLDTMTPMQMIEELIDQNQNDLEQSKYLKALAKEIMDEAR